MSKLHFFSLTALITLFALPACRKYCGPVHNPGDPATQCRVVNLRVLSVYGENRYAISYNTAGDPVSLLVDSVNQNAKIGNLDHYYRYNASGKLSDQVITGIQGTLASGWHKYVYTAPDFIVDTVLRFNVEDPSSQPAVTAPTPSTATAYAYSINGFTLDAQGRVITIWTIPNDPSQPHTVLASYTYDANGNRVLPNANLGYDNKINVYRTNKVWQFLNVDYSKNNVIKTDSSYTNVYNSLGLPTDLQGLANFDDLIFLFGVNNFAPGIQISYACPMGHGPTDY